MRIDWPLKEEQAGRAGVEWDGDGHEDALTGGKHAAYRTERNAARHICECRPVQVALVAWTRNHAGKTDVCAISVAIEMPDDAH